MRKLILIAVTVAALLPSGTARGTESNQTRAAAHDVEQTTPRTRVPPALTGCTIAVPRKHATVEAQMPRASDFCELLSDALAQDAFHSSVLVTPGRLWHYAGASISCELRYRRTLDHITIRNSAPACRWLTRPETSWHRLRTTQRILALG